MENLETSEIDSFFLSNHILKGIWTISPKENCPVKVKVSFKIGGQPDNCHQGKLPPG